ncbi:MAG: cytochrome c3 family protein [Bacteroidales bacterium]|jgi:hypothetical protein
MRNSIFILLLFVAGNCLGQISPGDLTTAHSNLEGLSNCSKCHEVGKKVATAKCLECHKEIKELINLNKGYHASSEVKSKECFSCHNEHHGRNFKIVRFDTLKFDHKDARFELLGKHNTLTCKNCHKAAFIKERQSQKTQAGSYLGLGTACLDCHADYHQKTLSANCITCHNSNAFKPVLGFNHKKTKYPLVGRHQAVDCAKCHKVTDLNGKKFQKFSGIAFASCTDCHKDVHNNRFGKDCRKCHTEESFTKVAGLSTFNHEKTGYRLVGKHLAVECKSCHKQSLTAKLKFALCTDCHKDYHKGQLIKPGVTSDCKDCHSLAGFKGSSFTIERHNKGEFLLEGSHLATPCFACHKKGQEWIFKDLKKKCVDCHENIHQSYIDEKYFGNQKCESCHSVEAWSKINFDHNTTDFKLTGKHADTNCKKCHFKPDAEGKEIQRFSGLSMRCLECHADEHNKQFDTTEGASCIRCHGYDRWKPIQFNHDNTRFKLDGSHQNVACVKCHKEVSEGSTKYIKYKLGDITCASCHLR